VTLKTDVWSLGACLLEMLTGKPPYHHLRPPQIMNHLLNLQSAPEVPDASPFAALLRLCLDFDQARRPDAAELVALVDSLSAEMQSDLLPLPKNWTSDQTSLNPTRHFEVVQVVDPQVLSLLEVMIVQGNGIGMGGRDQQGPAGYTKLKVECAWQIENRSLWGKFFTHRTEIKDLMRRMTPEQRSQLPKPNLRASLAEAGRELAQRGEAYEPIANEAHLLHGLGDPSKVPTIASGGFNEHFSGSNAGTMFGSGIYLAEDVGKCDQYCKPASSQLMWSGPSCLAGLLGCADELRGKELRFIFVCRTLLGCMVQVGQDRDHRLGTQVFESTCVRACVRACE
jgi:hypothetical protein